MENRYYTPKIEEFYIGFEYETYDMSNGGFVIWDPNDWAVSFMKEPDNHMWYHTELRFPRMPIDTAPNLIQIQQRINENRIRVKYLDKIDLAQIGFNIIHEEKKAYGYYIQAKLNYEDNGSPRELDLWYSHLKDKENIYLSMKSNHFNGNCKVYIKNKSELKKLLEQMDIL